jgi:hypothetical protein|tara:strand:- start:2447 stop:2872 length:426 start_codon:yes stop_codon:yes gene_type:complete
MFEKTTDVTRRLNQWRELRQNAPSEEAVLEAFSQVKIRQRYLDYWTPKDWPNAFEILEHGYFCSTGIAILLYQTLGNLKYLNPNETTWKVISNHVTGNDGAVFIHADKVYNLTPGQTNSLDELVAHSITLKDFKSLYIPII